MTGKIEPALTATQWGPMPRPAGEYCLGDRSDRLAPRVTISPDGISIHDGWGEASEAPLDAVIALANHAYRDDDPRKITRAWVDRVRRPHTDDCSMWWLSDYPNAQTCNCGGDDRLDEIAAALESYLRPRES